MMGISSAFVLTRRLGLAAFAVTCLLPAAAGITRAADSEKTVRGPAAEKEATSAQAAKTMPSAQAVPIHLRYMKPTDFTKVYLEMSSVSPFWLSLIQSITPDDAHQTVMVEGDIDAVNNVRESALLLDVLPRQMKLIVRFTHAPDAKQPDSLIQPVLAVATLQVKNNEPVDVSVFADHHLMQAHITPHINGDNATVSLAMSLTSQLAGVNVNSSSKDETARLRAAQSAFTYAGPTWYQRTAIVSSDFHEIGSDTDPAKANTVSYAGGVDVKGNLSLPPKGEYAISVVPVLVSAETPLQK